MPDSPVRMGLWSQLRPTVNFANYMTTEQNKVWGPRIIPDCQIIYTIAGEAQLTLGNETIALTGGTGAFYGAHSPHVIRVPDDADWTFTSIHFSWDQASTEPVHPGPSLVSCAADELSQPPVAYAIDVDGSGEIAFPHVFMLPNLEPLFMQIVREYRFQEPGYGAVMRGLLVQLLTVILRHRIEEGREPATRRKIAPALEAIRKHPDIVWTTAELASKCSYHPTYFAELFRDSTGMTPKHYLALERIRKAKYLLLEEATVEAVAAKLGYSSVHYFCRHFKLETGLTPTQFKRRSIGL